MLMWWRCHYKLLQGSRHNVFDDAPIYELSAGSSGEKDAVLLRMGNTKSRLFIDCVTPSHAGTYTCVAETPTKRVITSGIVEVGELTLNSVYWGLDSYTAYNFTIIIN
jgi:hypothetical protein